MIVFQKMLPEIYAKFRFGSFGFVSVNPTEISVSVVSVFTCFGRPLQQTGIIMVYKRHQKMSKLHINPHFTLTRSHQGLLLHQKSQKQNLNNKFNHLLKRYSILLTITMFQ